MTKTRVKYGANGAIYYEPIEDTPVVEEKKQVISEIFDEVDLTAAEYKPKKKKKKKVIQEVFADNEDL